MFLKIFGRKRKANDFSDEVEAHIQLEAARLREQGLSDEDARAAAHRAFGNVTKAQERFYESRRWLFWDNLWRDIRYSFHLLRKSPSFTFAAILTLAMAIGANAVAFAALDGLVLRPLNVPQPQTLYSVERATDKMNSGSYLNYLDFRDRNHSFTDLAADNISAAGLDNGKNPTQVWLYEVTGNYFDVLGLHPYLGRFFHASDERGPGSAPYVVLSHAYWRTHFQSDPAAVGRTIYLNKHPFTIIGVAPPKFIGSVSVFAVNMFVPVVNQEQIDGVNLLNDRRDHWMTEAAIGRLKPGVTPAQAVADLNSIGAYLKKTYPKDEGGVTFMLVGEDGRGDVNDPIQAFVTGLMLLAGLILLAACANLGSLFAARAADRSREVALRLALGAGRIRILRQLFTEAILISLAGGAIGLFASIWLLDWLVGWNPFPEFPLNMPVHPGASVYLVALLLSIASGFLFGAVPVRQVLRTDPYQVVKSGSLAKVGRRIAVRDLLLVVQIALCAVLVTSSSVAVRGLVRSLRSNFGFDPGNTMLVSTDLHMAGYNSADQPAMQRRMIDAMKTIPAVESVGMIAEYPPLHMGWNNQDVFRDDAANLTPSNAAASAIDYSVSPGYFRAARTALLRGRNFTRNDGQKSPLVAIVNETFARKVFGSVAKAIGGYFKARDGKIYDRIQVVGVVENGKYTANLTEDPQPAMFQPILQSVSSGTWLVLRSNLNPQELATGIRSKLRDLDPSLPSFIQTWDSEMSGAMFAPRMAAISLGVLGLMGALLSVTGIFGMAAYSVSKRKRELGIRMALGAQRKEVLQAALGHALRLLAFGSAVGLLLGILASRVLAYIVFEATPRDPLVLAGVVLAMGLLGLLATWIPAQRALSIDPAMLLREE